MAPRASWIEEMACEAFQYSAKSSGEVCTWNWVLVQAASGTIESEVVSRRSTLPIPAIEIEMSSPRALRICSLSSL